MWLLKVKGSLARSLRKSLVVYAAISKRLTLPRIECGGFLVPRADLPSSPLEEDSRGHLSPSVCFSEEKPVPWCPQVRYLHLPDLSEVLLRSNQTARCDEWTSLKYVREFSSCCSGALREQAFRFLVCFGFNTGVFLPVALRHRTHTLFSCSKYCREYIILTCKRSMGILATWKRKNKRPCDSLRKICKLLHAFGSCTGASPIRRRFGWLCKLWLRAASRLHPYHAPKGRPIHPPLERRGLSGPFTVSVRGVLHAR